MRFRCFIAVAVAALALAENAGAAEAPTIRNVNIRGLQAGGTTTLVIDGTDLLPEPRLVMSLPIAQQAVRPNPTATRVEFDVTLDAQTVPGLYNLRLATPLGVSSGVVVAVDTLPQLPLAKDCPALPVALHSVLSGSGSVSTTFTGTANQAVLIEVEAQRLGGKLRPVLHLLDAAGKQLAWALPSPALRGDTRLTAKLPADGKYTVQVHDLQYAAAAPNHFRLKIGQWQFADQVFPPAVERGKPAVLELIGSATADPKVSLAAPQDRTLLPVPWGSRIGASGLRPGVLISDLPEMQETPGGDMQTISTLPQAFSGRLEKPGEEDRFRLAVKPGTTVRFEVFADRIQSPLDAVIEIRKEDNARLALNDDGPGTPDPRLDFPVPAGVEVMIVAIKDVHGGGDPRQIYRIVMTTVAPTPNDAAGDFQLTIESDGQNVANGDFQVFRVAVERNGYQGPIEVGFEQLPAGVQVTGGQIPAGGSGTLLTLTGAGNLTAPVVTAVRGVSTDPNLKITRIAQVEKHPIAAMQPWLSAEVALSLASAKELAVRPSWGELPADAPLVIGGTMKIPLKYVSPVGDFGGARAYLVAGQNGPKVNGVPDPNQTLRPATGAFLEIPVDKAAQAAYDARVAAEKVVTESKAKAKTVADAAAKADVDAAAKAKDAIAKRDPVEKASLAAAVTAKTSADVKAAAEKILIDAQAKAKAVQDSGLKSVADATAKLSDATAKKTAADKTVETLTAAAKVAADAKAAAEQVLAAAEAKAKEVAGDAKASEEAAAKVKEATEKKLAAEKAASDAAQAVVVATEAKVAADKLLAAADIELKATTAATTKANADAAAVTQDAAAKLAAADKALVAATLAAKTAADALAVADKARVDFETQAKTIAAAGLKANADAGAVVQDAATKLTAAEQAAIAAAAAAKNEGEFVIQVPANLPAAATDLAFRIELLSRDKAAVKTVAFTPVRRVAALNPLVVKWGSALNLEARLDGKNGVDVKCVAEVQRLAGFQGDVTVTLAGLPAGIAVPTAVVGMDQTEFELVIKFPATFKPAELKDLKLFATGKYDPKNTIVNRSEDLALTLNLLPAEPEAAK